jgi:predicted DNA-binding protein
MKTKKDPDLGKPITIRPPKDLRERLERMARPEGRSLSWLIVRCIEIHLPVLEEQLGIVATRYRIRPQASEMNDSRNR